MWCLQNEPDPGSCTYGPAVLVRNAAAAANPRGLGGVRVLNLLWTQNHGSHKIGDPAQDILYRNPIPEPTSMFLVGTGLIGLRAWRKRGQ
jgi:hypothetical protein